MLAAMFTDPGATYDCSTRAEYMAEAELAAWAVAPADVEKMKAHKKFREKKQPSMSAGSDKSVAGSGVRSPWSVVRGPGAGVRGTGSRVRGPGSRVRAPSSGRRALGIRASGPSGIRASGTRAPGSGLWAPGSEGYMNLGRVSDPGSRGI